MKGVGGCALADELCGSGDIGVGEDEVGADEDGDSENGAVRGAT